MVSGCFENNHVKDLVEIEGVLLKDGYKSILKQNVLQSGQQLIARGFNFKEVNDKKCFFKLYFNFMAYTETCDGMAWLVTSLDELVMKYHNPVYRNKYV
jgi:hypothetical protein